MPDGKPLLKSIWVWTVASDGTPFACKGDSGSWIWNGKFQVVGMLWGGDLDESASYFTTMDSIIGNFGDGGADPQRSGFRLVSPPA
jgi:hypothetical protein